MVWEGPAQGVRFESPYTNPVPVKERGEREKRRHSFAISPQACAMFDLEFSAI